MIGPSAGAPRGRRFRGRVVVAAAALAALLLVGLGAGLAAFRYLPALDDARGLRSDIESIVEHVQEAGLEIDRATIDELDERLVTARSRHARLVELTAGDPLIAVARVVPPFSASVREADGMLGAGGSLLDAVGNGLEIGRRYVGIRDRRAANQVDGSMLAELVELLASSRDEAARAAASVADARRALAAAPDGAIPQLGGLRDAMSARIERYAPILETYLHLSEGLPAIFGWNGTRRYLVLTQDPAELRPTGGFIGSYGIITFASGALTEHRFEDVVPLDFPWDYPRIEPPQELADYLLGARQPWQFADANWSPDFPTAARDALRLYTNESGDARIDGVIGITTYTIDEILKVTGPVHVPDYDVTIASGETTLKTLQLTRTAGPGEDRKAFLPAFAERLIAAVFSLPSRSWADLPGAAGTLRDGRHVLAWFPDPTDQALAARAGVDGAVRQDRGDYVFPVDANVSPASKLSAWTARALDLDVQIDEFGNARTTLQTTWTNGVDTEAGASYREMENVGGRILGVYFRLLVPELSRFESVTGGTLAPVDRPAVISTEAGRSVVGAYVKVPAGDTTLQVKWTSPYAADLDSDGGGYRLTIQAQPGMRPGPLRLTIRVPGGNRITAASPELVVSGTEARLEATFDRDLTVGLRFAR